MAYLHAVLLELGGHGLLELGGHAGDLVFVRTSLECWENRLVDLGAEVALVLSSTNTNAGGKEGRQEGRRENTNEQKPKGPI